MTKCKNIIVVSVMWCLRFVTSTLCAATFSNIYVKWHLRYVMLHFVAVPFFLILNMAFVFYLHSLVFVLFFSDTAMNGNDQPPSFAGKLGRILAGWSDQSPHAVCTLHLCSQPASFQWCLWMSSLPRLINCWWLLGENMALIEKKMFKLLCQ